MLSLIVSWRDFVSFQLDITSESIIPANIRLSVAVLGSKMSVLKLPIVS